LLRDASPLPGLNGKDRLYAARNRMFGAAHLSAANGRHRCITSNWQLDPV
jgi:hypothetical protein